MSNRAPTALPPFGRAKIIEMATEAGFISTSGWWGGYEAWPDDIERFAALVRAQALEEAAQVCDLLDDEVDGCPIRVYWCAERIRSIKGEA